MRDGGGVERRRGAELAPKAGQALAPRGGVHPGRRWTNLSGSPCAEEGKMAIEGDEEDSSGGYRGIRLRRWKFLGKDRTFLPPPPLSHAAGRSFCFLCPTHAPDGDGGIWAGARPISKWIRYPAR